MELKVKPKVLSSASQEIRGSSKAIRHAGSQVESVMGKLELGSSTDTIRRKLRGLSHDLEFLDAATTDFRRALEDISLQYMLTEAAIKNKSVKVLDPEVIKKVREAVERTGKTIGDSLRKGDHPSNVMGGDPVNIDTGNYIYEKEDLRIKGPEGFNFRRFYNSMENRTGILGRGWTHNYEVCLEMDADTVTVVLSDGREELFAGSAGGFASVSGSTAVLGREGSGYRYTTIEGTAYTFNERGKLTRREDANGNGYSLEYTGDTLNKVVNDGGEYYSFEYTDKDPFRLTSVTDHTGRSSVFGYEGDQLTSVTTGSRVTAYVYDAAGRLATIISPRGIKLIHNQYDAMGRTMRQDFPDESFVTFEYDEATGATVMKERNGTESSHFHDELYRNTENVYPDGSESSRFNERNQLVYRCDRNGNVTHYTYDNRGNVSKATLADGTVITMTYEKHNKPVSVSVNGVRKLKNVYDAKGNILETTDGIGRTTSYKYNDRGFVTEIRRPGGAVTGLEYDERGNVSVVTGENGARTEYSYDPLNRVVSSTDGRGNVTCYEYDEYNNLVKVTNAKGHTRSYTYNEIDKVTCFRDFNGATRSVTYNVLGRPETITDALGRVMGIGYDKMWNESTYHMPDGGVRHIEYDENNNVSRRTDALGNSVLYEYDGNGNITSVTDPEGGVTTYAYDSRDQVISMTDPEGNETTYEYEEGRPVSVRSASGGTTSFEYDDADQLIRETNALGDTREYTYTADGDIASVTDEAGRTTIYEYASQGNPSRVAYPDGREELFTYDENGNVKTRSNKQGFTVTYIYDELNRVCEIRDSEGAVTSYAHDEVGNITSMTDPKGNTTTYSYTLTGKLSSVTDALGNRTDYEYDEMDRLIGIDQHGDGETHSTRYVRDLEGNVIESIDALGLSDKYTYNGRGDILTKLDKDGYLTQYGYNNNGDLDSITYGDGKAVMMSYDALRKLSEVIDWTGRTSVETDILGRAVKVTYPDNRFAAYTYGRGGERTGITYPDGRSVKYTYDDALRLASLSEGDTKVEYSYDGFGRLAGKVFANGLAASYAYNERGMLTELKNSMNGEVLDSYGFAYDVMGSKTSVSVQRKDMADENGMFEYGYDALGRLETVSRGGVLKKRYSYDAFGNRVALDEEGARSGYRFNAMNQLTESVSPDGTKELFTYDRRGNLVRRSIDDMAVNSYSYGSLNRLESAHGSKGFARYEYNGLGHRIEEQITSAADPERKIRYTVDLTREYHNLLERDVDGSSEAYLWDSTAVAMKGRDNSAYYYADDDLGSPVRLIDGAGIVAASCCYDEFGRMVSDGRMHEIQPFGYTGYRVDSVADTYFAQAREYMPEYGRFAAQDRIKGSMDVPETQNNYVYCWNDPLVLVDMDGNRPSIRRIGPSIKNIGSGVLDKLESGVSDTSRIVGIDKKSVVPTPDGTITRTVHQGGDTIVVTNYEDGGTRGITVNRKLLFLEQSAEYGSTNPLDWTATTTINYHTDKTTGATNYVRLDIDLKNTKISYGETGSTENLNDALSEYLGEGDPSKYPDVEWDINHEVHQMPTWLFCLDIIMIFSPELLYEVFPEWLGETFPGLRKVPQVLKKLPELLPKKLPKLLPKKLPELLPKELPKLRPIFQGILPAPASLNCLLS